MSVSIDGYEILNDFSETNKTRVKEMSFGGGYRNILEDGLNSKHQEIDINFAPLATANNATLKGILLNSTKSTAGQLSYTVPSEGTVSYFTAHDITVENLSPTLFRTSCKLRKEYII